VLGLLGPQPLHDAVDVEAVAALTPDKGAVIASKLAVRAATIESYSADSTGVVISQPLPHSNPGPGADVDPELGGLVGGGVGGRGGRRNLNCLPNTGGLISWTRLHGLLVLYVLRVHSLDISCRSESSKC